MNRSRMPKLARTVFPSVPHHVTQRGNRQDVFFTDEDRHAVLEWMREYCAIEKGVRPLYPTRPLPRTDVRGDSENATSL